MIFTTLKVFRRFSIILESFYIFFSYRSATSKLQLNGANRSNFRCHRPLRWLVLRLQQPGRDQTVFQQNKEWSHQNRFKRCSRWSRYFSNSVRGNEGDTGDTDIDRSHYRSVGFILCDEFRQAGACCSPGLASRCFCWMLSATEVGSFADQATHHRSQGRSPMGPWSCEVALQQYQKAMARISDH